MLMTDETQSWPVPTMGILMAHPHDDLAPLMAWMEDRRREKDRRQRSQDGVLLYEWSHLEASMEASLL